MDTIFRHCFSRQNLFFLKSIHLHVLKAKADSLEASKSLEIYVRWQTTDAGNVNIGQLSPLGTGLAERNST